MNPVFGLGRNNVKKLHALLMGLPMASLSFNVASVEAAEPAVSKKIDEIVITAQRRSESIQDVGIAVSAFSGDSLRAQGITSSIEVSKFTPGVNVSGTVGGQSMQFSIRGVTQSDNNDAIEAPVAVYVDDTYISSMQGQGMALFDLERVEVLKGPQGTLFGRNATGGLVHFIVRKPDLDEVNGYVDATYGRFNQVVLESALNLPLDDKLAMRLSGNWKRNGHIWNNHFPEGLAAGAPVNFGPEGVSPGGEDIGNQDDLSGRAQMLFEASDKLSVRLTGTFFRQHLSESPWTSSSVMPVLDSADRIIGAEYMSLTDTFAAIGPDGENFFDPSVLPFQGFLFSPNNDGERVPGASTFGYVPLDMKDRNLSKDFALSDLNRFKAYNTALHINAHFDDFDVVSVTSYSKYKKTLLLDADGSPANAFLFGTQSDTDTFSQEVRVTGGSSSLEWVAGAYYLDITADVDTGLLAPKGSALAAVFGMQDTGVDPVSGFQLKTQSASAFGQFSWEFVPQWSLVVGGRLIREHQEYEYGSFAYANVGDYSIDTGTALFPLLPAFNDKRTNTLWTGKSQIEYRPNSDLLLYSGVNRGVKGGSYNGQLFDGSPALDPSEIAYKPEVLTSFESGFKLSGDNYTLNGSIYHYRYNNYQSFVFSTFAGYVRNQKARTNGVELEATAQVTNDLRLGLSGAFMDAEVKDFEIAPGVLRDTRPTYTPKYTSVAWLNYTVPQLVADGTLDFGAVLTYQSSMYHNVRNFNAHRIKERTLLDLNVNWALENGVHFDVYLKNVFDSRYKTVGLDLTTACGCSLEAYGMPRTWGVTAGYKF